jgi:predicted RNA-binding Zn-ribbon protein involved in translation (DUF1610 family)
MKTTFMNQPVVFTRSLFCLLATILFLGSGILALDATAAPKAKKPTKKLENWSAADWEKYGADLAKKPALQKMSPLDRAKYIADDVGKKYDAAKIKPNTSYFGKGRANIPLWSATTTPGTCGDLTVNLQAALGGAGFRTGNITVEKRGVKNYIKGGGPFDVNQNHGAPLVLIDGKQYVFDLWYHSYREGKFSGFASVTNSGPMLEKDWRDTLGKNMGYKSKSSDNLRDANDRAYLRRLRELGVSEKEARFAAFGGVRAKKQMREKLNKMKEEAEAAAAKEKIEKAKEDEAWRKKAEEFSKKDAAKEARKQALWEKRNKEKEEAIARLKEAIRISKLDEAAAKAELEKKEAATKAAKEKFEKAELEKKEAAAKAEKEKLEKAAAKAKQEKLEKAAKAEQEKIEAAAAKAEQEKIEAAAAKAEQEKKEQLQKEREAAREPGSVRDNGDGTTTTTKGYVKNNKGRITLTETQNPDGSVTTTTTETDRDGNIISESSYDDSGEGKPTDLRGAEPESDAEVDAETAANGAKTADSYGNSVDAEQQQRGANDSGLMAQNTQMDEAANVGNQMERVARRTRDRGGQDADSTADTARRKTNKSDGENSWTKALGDGVESGITEGGKQFGKAFGGAASDAAVGAIFGPKKDESSSGGGSGGASVAGGGAAAPAAGKRPAKGKPKKKPKTKPGGSSSGGSSGGGGASEGEEGDILISTSGDIPLGDESIDGSGSGSSGSSSSSGSVRHCPKCGRTQLTEIISDNTVIPIVHEFRCPDCGVEAVLGPPPAGLGEDSGSSSSDYDEPQEEEAPSPPKKTRDACPICKGTVKYSHTISSYDTLTGIPDPLNGNYYHCSGGHTIVGHDNLITVEIE